MMLSDLKLQSSGSPPAWSCTSLCWTSLGSAAVLIWSTSVLGRGRQTQTRWTGCQVFTNHASHYSQWDSEHWSKSEREFCLRLQKALFVSSSANSKLHPGSWQRCVTSCPPSLSSKWWHSTWSASFPEGHALLWEPPCPRRFKHCLWHKRGTTFHYNDRPTPEYCCSI